MKVSFLDQKLGALLHADVNEEVPNILTAWVSALIVTPKQDGDIQVCVDMSRANEAIVCEQGRKSYTIFMVPQSSAT